MSTNHTTSSLVILHLNDLQRQLIRILWMFLVVGLLGNLASCVVFFQKKLRSNAMALLFSAASIFNIIALIYGISGSLYDTDHTNPQTYSIFYCKCRLYFRHCLLMTVRTYILLACVASYALSSPRTALRSLCQTHYIKRIIISVPFVWPLIAFHMPIWTIIDESQCVNVDSYVLAFGIYSFVIIGILPVMVMSLFILLTVHNLNVLHRRIQPSLAGQFRVRSRDRQFIRMLTALVLMYMMTNIFFPTNTLYLAITHWMEKSPERVGIESLVFSITGNHILYINNVSPFFLFFSSSAVFRKSLRSIFLKYWNYLLHKNNDVRQAPVTVLSSSHNPLRTPKALDGRIHILNHVL